MGLKKKRERDEVPVATHFHCLVIDEEIEGMGCHNNSQLHYSASQKSWTVFVDLTPFQLVPRVIMQGIEAVSTLV